LFTFKNELTPVTVLELVTCQDSWLSKADCDNMKTLIPGGSGMITDNPAKKPECRISPSI
jgi:hypothetical protein